MTEWDGVAAKYADCVQPPLLLLAAQPDCMVIARFYTCWLLSLTAGLMQDSTYICWLLNMTAWSMQDSTLTCWLLSLTAWLRPPAPPFTAIFLYDGYH